MKKIIALLLSVILLISVFPSALAAETNQEPDDIWADISEAENRAINGMRATIEAVESAYSKNIDKIIAAVEASDAYVPGTIIRHGDFFYFTTKDGTVNGYSPRLRARVRTAVCTGADPEAVSGIETTSFAARGGSPGSTDVAVFQPYYGLDSSFTTQYPNEGVSIAQATGGTNTTYKTNDATIDNIASAIETCGVVIFDSHGDTDYASGSDYTSRANTSYICLQSGAGFTSEDQVAVSGPYGTYYHAYYAGSGYGGMKYYCADGTAISNHMSQNSPNGLLWMAICLGMATDGLQAPMRDRGVEVVYGYSQSVTFAGDFAWEEVFWDHMKDGENVADSIAVMKSQIGCPDPYTYNYPAYPIVVSDEDEYPGHGNVDANQTVYSTWTLFQQHQVNAYSSNPSMGTVSVNGSVITAHPATGCYTAGYAVTQGTAIVEMNGNTLTVYPETDCTVRVDFGHKNPATVTYHVPDGMTCETYQGYEGDSIVLPTPTGSPAADGEDYHFIGWLSAELDDTEAQPENVYHAGDELLLTSSQVDFYALFTYFKADNPNLVGQFIRVDKTPDTWEGEIVITYNGQKALDASGAHTGSGIYSKDAVIDLASYGVIISEDHLDKVGDDLIFVVTRDDDGAYRIKMKNVNTWLCLTNNSQFLNTVNKSSSPSARWNLSCVDGISYIRSGKYPERMIRYNAGSSQFLCYKEGEKEPVTVFKANPGKDYYTTTLHDKIICDVHEFGEWSVTTEPTCVATGLQERTCSVCGFVETEVLGIDPNRHTGNTELRDNQAATCTDDGYTGDTYCADCGAKLVDGVVIPATGHAWGEWAEQTAPTCTEDGVEVRTCVTCGVAETSTIPALGHSWDAGVVTKEPTEVETGVKTFICSVCGETRTETIPTVSCPCAQFTDMPPYGTDEHAAIEWAFTHDPQITKGTDATHFSPTDTVTRAQAVTFLWRAAGCPEPKATQNPFTDVLERHYFYKPVLWAVEEGITLGTTATTFSPYQTCNIEQIITFIYRYAKEPAIGEVTSLFTDVTAGKYYYNPIMWAYENGIYAGKSATVFGRKDDCQRAQIVTFLWRNDKLS